MRPIDGPRGYGRELQTTRIWQRIHQQNIRVLREAPAPGEPELVNLLSHAAVKQAQPLCEISNPPPPPRRGGKALNQTRTCAHRKVLSSSDQEKSSNSARDWSRTHGYGNSVLKT